MNRPLIANMSFIDFCSMIAPSTRSAGIPQEQLERVFNELKRISAEHPVTVVFAKSPDVEMSVRGLPQAETHSTIMIVDDPFIFPKVELLPKLVEPLPTNDKPDWAKHRGKGQWNKW